METIEKINIAKIKADIKKMVENQRLYKSQRKTVNLVGEREMSPSEAHYKHLTNRMDLRIMYAAYGVARGKSFSVIENKFEEENHPLNRYSVTIERYLKKYTEKVEVLEAV